MTVSDGFVGHLLLKLAEGIVAFFMQVFRGTMIGKLVHDTQIILEN
ncbi:MAG: hypothetical protein IV090_11395 [Candidatus Sericytochromatia bacterium]|nr:hypothetical protein [Candidatus Sericytochromatia bacterium]